MHDDGISFDKSLRCPFLERDWLVHKEKIAQAENVWLWNLRINFFAKLFLMRFKFM
jgi:hypothetical protein